MSQTETFQSGKLLQNEIENSQLFKPTSLRQIEAWALIESDAARSPILLKGAAPMGMLAAAAFGNGTEEFWIGSETALKRLMADLAAEHGHCGAFDRLCRPPRTVIFNVTKFDDFLQDFIISRARLHRAKLARCTLCQGQALTAVGDCPARSCDDWTETDQQNHDIMNKPLAGLGVPKKN